MTKFKINQVLKKMRKHICAHVSGERFVTSLTVSESPG